MSVCFIRNSLAMGLVSLHNFVQGLLLFIGCQLHQLNPTGILHIANFITFYECYLGMAPPFDLFHHLFCIRPQMNGDDVHDLGGVSLQLRPASKFFPVAFPQSMRSWHKNWVYVSVLATACRPSSGELRGCFNPGSLWTSFPRTYNCLLTPPHA